MVDFQKINFLSKNLSLESWVDLVSLQEIDNKKSYLSFSPYQFMWISNKY